MELPLMSPARAASAQDVVNVGIIAAAVDFVRPIAGEPGEPFVRALASLLAALGLKLDLLPGAQRLAQDSCFEPRLRRWPARFGLRFALPMSDFELVDAMAERQDSACCSASVSRNA
jgi:hypothetical protein